MTKTPAHVAFALLVIGIAAALPPRPAAAAENDAEKIERLIERAQMDLSKERYEKALKRFFKAGDLAGGASPEILAGLADAYLGLSEYQAAIDTADRLLEVAEDDRQRAKAHNVIGLAYFGRGQEDVTSSIFIPNDPNSREAAERLKEELHRRRDATQQEYLAAADSFRRVIELTGGRYAAPWQNYAEALFRGDRHEEALEVLERLDAGLPEGEELPEQAARLRSCLELLVSDDGSAVYNLADEAEGSKIEPPRRVVYPQPQYTEIARKNRLQGRVVVKGIVDREGHYVCAQVLEGLPMGLTDATLRALRSWEFEPATLDGEPVAVHYWLTTTFALQ